MKILCIIVTYNGMRWIAKCLQSITQSTIPMDVFIIDNNSSDGTIDYLDSLKGNYIIHKSQINLGFGQANNVGIKYALSNGYDYVLLLNQDAYIKPDMIEKILPHMRVDGIYSPIHINGEEKRIDENFRKFSICSNPSILDDLCLSKDNSPYWVNSVNAACWFSPVSIFKRIGGFNPLFHHYGEDSNYISRMHFNNCCFYVVLDSFVVHDRKVFGNEILYRKDQLSRSFLRIATDINLNKTNRIKGYLKVLVSFIQKASLCKAIMQLPSATWLILSKHRKIKHSRELEIVEGTNWL